MRNANGYQSEIERNWKNRMNRNMNISSIERVNRKLKEVSRFSRAKQRQGNVQKSVLHVLSWFFFCWLDLLLLFFTALVVFTLSR